MRPQAYQTPEIRDENDKIIQQGTFGKKTPFVNSQNDGILDYIINNLESIKGVSLAATVVVSSLPSAGQAGKFYLLDDGTENSGKVYIYKDRWIEVTTQAVGLSAYQIAKKNGYEGTEQEWLENEVYGGHIVSAETDSDGYFIVHTRQGKTIKTALKPLVDAKASADKAKISETNAKTSETNSANSAAAALASQEASANSQTKAKTSETNAKTSELNAKASENNAKTSETNAKNSATAAAGSASVATTQAANSSNSATASQKSATASADSASAAHVSEVNASSSASAASVSAGKAKTSETNAKTSETNAKASELNAKASESNAKSSENLAKAWAMSESSPDGVNGNKSSKTWANEAKNSASSASTSASTATTKATEATNSATKAKTSETNAANSASAAAQSAENAKLWDPTEYAKLKDCLLLTEYGKKIIESERITDLNSVKCIAYPSWYCRYSSTLATLTNIPPLNHTFHLFNFSNITANDGTIPNIEGSYYYIVQLLISEDSYVWIRNGSNGKKSTFNFSKWKQLETTDTIEALKTDNNALREYLHRFGENATPPTAGHDVNNWGIFSSYYKSKVIDNQPTDYGQLINLPPDNSYVTTQLWLDYTGKMFYRGAGYNGVINDIPFTRFLDTNDLSSYYTKAEVDNKIAAHTGLPNNFIDKDGNICAPAPDSNTDTAFVGYIADNNGDLGTAGANINIKSWYGIGFINANRADPATTNKVTVGIDVRKGTLKAHNVVATDSLTVSGETSVPTPSTENNSKTIANTEFVHGVISNLVNGAPTALDTLQELATALGNDPNFSTTILNKIGEKESKTDAQIEHKRLQDAIPTKVSQLSNDSGYLTEHQSLDGYVKTVNNTAPDENGNVTITVSGGGGVSTSKSNTWTGKQTFREMKFKFESYSAPRSSGAFDNPFSSVAVYNVQGDFTLDMSSLAGLLSNGDATLFTAYITSNGVYTLSIVNAGSLKYVGSASDLAITANGMILIIMLIKGSNGDLSTVVQASALS